MSAAPPTRKYGSMDTMFGPITLRLDLYAHCPDSESSAIKRSEYVKQVDSKGNETFEKVGRVSCVKETGEVITDTSQVVKLVEASDGTLVELTEEEIDAHLAVQAGGIAPIVKFLPDNLIGTHYLTSDKIYQVRPPKAGSKRGTKVIKKSEADADAKAFALALAGMRKANVFALIQVTRGGKSHFAALRSDGRLYTLKYDDEVREDLPLPDVEVTETEITLAVEKVIGRNLSTEPVDLVDEVSTKIRSYVDVKAKGQGLAVSETPVIAAPNSADFTSMLAAL